MKQFRLVDNLLGWLAFLIAAIVYCSTIEPTASFWDCPEFIVTGYKLEVGHPPGAPFFMLTANLFSQFVSDPAMVARMVNTMSALLSATCIMFLFWTITHLARKLIVKDWDSMTTAKLIAIEASGLVGALIYTFSDTFWFSAVEGEVYAYSSAFTAVMFWLILKGEDHADEPHSDRWLILIAYMTGLSIGVHLLNLLCIPAIVLVYYYRRFPNADAKGSLIALCVSFAVVAAVLYGIVPGVITVGGWFELLFVNILGMSFNTGLYLYIILLTAAIIWGVYETQYGNSLRRQNISFITAITLLGIPFYGWGMSAVIIGIIVLAALAFLLTRKRAQKQLVSARLKNTILLCLMMIMIGYSSYAVIVIRSSANTPMDQNSPEDIFTLGNYLSRDQYGYRPLMYGQAYSSEYKINDNGYGVEMRKEGPIYQRREKANPSDPDEYFIVDYKQQPNYAQNMLFPRMWSKQHTNAYEQWFGGYQNHDGQWVGGIEGTEKPSNYQEGYTVKIPTQIENLKFFISYQCNWMYWRYFLWNFAGRQNDLQGHGDMLHGNWLSGISFIDNMRLGDQSMLPDELKDNKGHNVFYCLPLLLGLIGLFWQAFRGQRGIRQFWVVFFLFVMTGLAIVVYLNQTPMQPRERDYAYAGSFYAYAIWCGLGVVALFDLLKKALQKKKQMTAQMQTVMAAAIALLCLIVPIQMASQTWDDHDRSDRYVCRDFGQNYLMSLQAENYPIIFTNGDNDTFPLWYCQEAEGIRTDARVCNLSYLQTDWYIDQMKRPAYDSPAVPISWARIDYCEGTNNSIDIEPDMKQQILEFYAQNPEQAKKQFGDEPFELKNVLKYWVRNTDADMRVIPTDTVYMTIDKEAVRRSGMLLQDSIPDKMIISFGNRQSLGKGDLMMLEMIANTNWTRPLYVATTVGNENFMNLGENFVREGMAYRITPFNTTVEGAKNIDTERSYDAIMNRFKFGGISKPGIYIDETVMRMIFSHIDLCVTVASELIEEGKNDKAAKLLAMMDKEFPYYNNIQMTYYNGGIDLIEAYGKLGNKKKMIEVADRMWKNSQQYMNFYLSLPQNKFMNTQEDCLRNIYMLNLVVHAVENYDSEWSAKHLQMLKNLTNSYQQRGGAMMSF